MNERLLELLERFGLPVRAVLSRYCVGAGEAEIEHVVVRVAVVAGDVAMWETCCGQGDGCFTRVRAAVGVAPDAVKLKA